MGVGNGLLPTTVVGSYPQPDWLIDRIKLRNRPPPRARAADIWRVSTEFLQQAQDDATILAIRDMEAAGIDIITDGEIRRESYSNRFVLSLEGFNAENPGTIAGRTGRPVQVPRVVSQVRWKHPVLLGDAEFLRKNTTRMTKATVPGPFTVTQQAVNEYYSDDASLAIDVAEAINQEAKALKSAGIDIIQLDEPYLQAAPEKAREYAVEAINRALEGVSTPTVLHTCFGYGYMIKDKPAEYPFLDELNECKADQLSLETAQPKLDQALLERIRDKKIILGVINLGDSKIESPEEVAARIRSALKHAPPERLVAAPDCGMKYLERGVAYAKLCALAQGAGLVRREIQ